MRNAISKVDACVFYPLYLARVVFVPRKKAKESTHTHTQKAKGQTNDKNGRRTYKYLGSERAHMQRQRERERKGWGERGEGESTSVKHAPATSHFLNKSTDILGLNNSHTNAGK